MPNERRRPRAAKRVTFLPRLRVAPVLLLGLVVVAVLGRAPQGEQPVRWTIRDADGWMNEFDGLRLERTAALDRAGVVLAAADPAPVAPDAAPASGDHRGAAFVVAEAEQLPRDVRKIVPRDVPEPEMTGSVPKGQRLQRPDSVDEPLPIINRTNKGDRLLGPRPLGQSTEQDLFVKPTLATVPPTLEGWPPLVAVASLAAPLAETTLPRQAMAAPDRRNDGRVVVAMVRTGPGRVVTQSAIAALGTSGRAKGRPLLPPVPEAQIAAANPRTQVWTQPAVPEIGYAKRAGDLLARFRSVLGDEDDAPAAAKPAPTADDDIGG